MKRYAIFICLLGMLAWLPAQDLTAVLLDANTGDPVPFAQVIIKGTERGVTSNSEGYFRFKQVELPVTLVVTDIRYETRQVKVNRRSTQIVLVPKDFSLEEVTIRPDGVKRVLEEPAFSVIDYGFYDDLIVMAVMKNRRTKSYVRVQDANGKLLWERRLSFVPDRFFEDCMGNLHLLSADSAYQLYYDYEKLYLLYPNERGYLLSKLLPCKALWNNRAYMQYSSRSGLIQHYFRAAGGEQKEMHRLADSTKIDYLTTNFDLHF